MIFVTFLFSESKIKEFQFIFGVYLPVPPSAPNMKLHRHNGEKQTVIQSQDESEDSLMFSSVSLAIVCLIGKKKQQHFWNSLLKQPVASCFKNKACYWGVVGLKPAPC